MACRKFLEPDEIWYDDDDDDIGNGGDDGENLSNADANAIWESSGMDEDYDFR